MKFKTRLRVTFITIIDAAADIDSVSFFFHRGLSDEYPAGLYHAGAGLFHDVGDHADLCVHGRQGL